MTQSALQNLRARFSSLLASSKHVTALENRYYTDFEIASLRRQVEETNRRARDAVECSGVTLHPRIAAIRKR